LSAGGPGSNLNAVLNAWGRGNTISAGSESEPSNLNAGFNFFGANNRVAAGPGPLALAGSVLRDGQIIRKTGPGIAINNFRIGGAAATSGQNSTVPTSNAVPTNTTRDRAKTSLNPGSSNNVPAAGGRQGSRVRHSLDSSPTGNNAASKSGNTSSPGGSARKSVSDQIKRSIKNAIDTASKATGGRGSGAKTGAATSNK
jgi:hypothetical protein